MASVSAALAANSCAWAGDEALGSGAYGNAIEIIQSSVWWARELLDFVMDALGPTKTRGPKLLQSADVALPLLSAGEVQIARRAIGVNFIGENFQFDLYSEPNPQRLISGTDAEGVIRETGSARRD